jgi:hypothetical protein
MELKKGDKVVVVDSGECYSTYEEWVKKFAPALFEEWKRGFRDARNGRKGIVLATAPHTSYGHNLCFVRGENDTLFLISERGLKLIERKPNMFTKDDLKTGIFKLETRNGHYAMVQDGSFSETYAQYLTHDLRDANGAKELDIVKVSELKSIWKREEPTEITVAEAIQKLKDAYGESFKISVN